MKKRWFYLSENFEGNVHQTVQTLNENNHWHSWEVVAMQFNGGGYTVVVFKKLVDK